MDKMIHFYQNLPFYADPAAFSVGSLQVDWYSLMYLAGFATVYFLLRYRIGKGESVKIRLDKDTLFSLLLWIFVGLLAGARIGYVFFYNFPYYLAHPLEIVSPFDEGGSFTGIYGMSYHGGLIGAVLVAYIYCRRNRMSFWRLANFVVPAVPAGYFFGRIGNFMNGELYGRTTDVFWGMHFPADSSGVLRHPSQLYEAFLEGFLLFAILWFVRNKSWAKSGLFAFYLIGYALARITVEFFRQPDEQIGYVFGPFTLGQMLSAGMLAVGLFLLQNTKIRNIWYNTKKHS